jgi:hypothetical protein
MKNRKIMAENIVKKMKILPFNSNELNEVGDIYPTEKDYIDTIGYNLNMGWVPDYKIFTNEEIEFINSL